MKTENGHIQVSGVHGDVVFIENDVVCLNHQGMEPEDYEDKEFISPLDPSKTVFIRQSRDYGPVTIGGGMISERGLICPICYRPARLATAEESERLEKSHEPHRRNPS